MFGLKRIVYSTSTLDELTASYTAGYAKKVNPPILANTISYSITRVRDTLSVLEQMTQDPRIVRGESTHMSRRHAKNGAYLSLQDVNDQTESVRGKLFSAMEPKFEQLDYETNRLGAAVKLLAMHFAHSLGEAPHGSSTGTAKLAQFFPEARYNGQSGKIEYRAAGGEYAPLKSFRELAELRGSLAGDGMLLSLLELKLAGAALSASIDSSVLREVQKIQNYPGDAHSEVMDAVQAVEGNLGYLSKQELAGDLQALVKRATPSHVTELLQVYVDHRINPWFARVAGGAALVTGTSAAILGVPQVYHWIKAGFDPTYTPVLSNRAGYFVALTLTSAAVSAILFGCLTIGSEIGSRLVRDMRNKLELRELKEV